MVNKVVLEYLRMHKGNYKIEDLKKKVIASGYSQKDVDEAMVQLNKETAGAVPSVPATINKINKTNIDMKAEAPVASTVESNVAKPKAAKPKKKKKGWLKWFIIIWIILLILAGIGVGDWFYMSGL